ncbi:hypothetical protein [Parabacteroides pacaensis]|uniref:hypothetical protein n=1 Tax=Parabacteroides pacaensis TaxID=2086575 RepID=UPI000D0ED2CB|nr:hypothetical protein [Parabacteroides pacaensis]
MRNFLILVYFIFGINNLYSQNNKEIGYYDSITKEYIKKSVVEEPYYSRYLHLRDTNNIALIIPIYLLRDSVGNSQHKDYSILSHFIDSIPSPYDQYAFIKQEKM